MTHDGHPRINRIFGEVNLTEDQLSQVSSLVDNMRAARILCTEEKRALIELFLNGEVTSKKLLIGALRDNRHQYQLEKVGLGLIFG